MGWRATVSKVRELYLRPIALYVEQDQDQLQKARAVYFLCTLAVAVITSAAAYLHFINGPPYTYLVGPLLFTVILILLVIRLLRWGMLHWAINGLVTLGTMAIWFVMYAELNFAAHPITATDSVVFVYAILVIAAFLCSPYRIVVPGIFLVNIGLLAGFALKMNSSPSFGSDHAGEYFFDNLIAILLIFIVTSTVRSINETSLIRAKEETAEKRFVMDTLESRVRHRTKDISVQKRVLEKERSRYKELVENANSIILRWDSDGCLTYFNEFAEKAFGFSREEVLGKHVVGTIVPETESGGRDLRPLMEDICKNPVGYEYNENENMRKDGSRLWVAWTNKVFTYDETGEREALSIGTDITAMRETREQLRRAKESAETAHDQLKRAQSELVSRAHRAGMAEATTSVLHNIGNVLTSVITSAEYIHRCASDTKLSKYHEANEILREQGDGKVEFIATDPRGETLLEYYLELENVLQGENKEIIDSAERLIDRVNIIREAIEAQQSYSGLGVDEEELDLNRALKDSIVIHDELIRTHLVTVEKRFRAMPLILANRTKLLYVFLNLIKNACEALLSLPAEERRLVISTTLSDDAIEIIFVDNGEGIAKGELERVFEHGYSHKDEGHGLGLHSSNKFILEMGGWVRAESAGPGKGATFTVHLPYSSGS